MAKKLGHFFPTAYNCSWVGIGFMWETDYKKPSTYIRSPTKILRQHPNAKQWLIGSDGLGWGLPLGLFVHTCSIVYRTQSPLTITVPNTGRWKEWKRYPRRNGRNWRRVVLRTNARISWRNQKIPSWHLLTKYVDKIIFFRVFTRPRKARG